MMIEAAILAQGIGIAQRSLVEQYIRSGQLARLFDFDCPSNKLIALFYHEAAENRPAIKALSNWMHAQIKSESL